jgi:hypothetical protein
LRTAPLLAYRDDVTRGRVLPLGIHDMSASAGRVWNSIRGYEPVPIDAWHSADMSMGSLFERREDQAHLLHQQSACQDSSSRALSARPWRCTSGAAAGSERVDFACDGTVECGETVS